MNVSDFDYNLPEELIAQKPSEKRDYSRLLVVDRKSGEIFHRHFYDVIDYLNPGDCLVINDSKVLPARLFGEKEGTGAKIEFLLTKRLEGDTWETMVRPGRRLKVGDKVIFGTHSDDEKYVLKAEILDYGEDGTRIVRFDYDGIFMERLEEIGSMPLPPYIERPADEADSDRYQTVYAREEGSVAAPTAGLHFTEELLEKVKAKGVKIAKVTLHVGIGTFRPVKAEKVEDHHMHFEEYEISEEAAALINETKEKGGRIIAVGTTSTRTLESAAFHGDRLFVSPGNSSTGIFIYPGYEFKIVDSLITNFHLPKSTLMMLISAFYDREKILKVYKEAVQEKYRFFSYGDAMLII
ncbi:MAG: tRNA preQ1(34) S-adenosylmethionine ribosyltransferase-isomerase QueA [Firmicutes bacterium]|nr:tRNA preQ1(34) S-adenosylmethionine ribosyltransferase-isomerase QueA [Bacillota bacterium]